MAARKIIIDTDPGVDDMLAMLLALASAPADLEVLMLSVTYGNVELHSCLRNVVTMFEVIDKEIAWREAQGRPVGFESLAKTKPLVAAGAEHPLDDQMLMADYFHGVDGLAGLYTSYPHMSPAETWAELFGRADAPKLSQHAATRFTASRKPAHREMLRLLRENEADTITIVAVGPLTNVALAAAEEPETFLRVKEVVVMGGAIDKPGNITPCAEFNTYADAVAAARVYALSSPTPASTLPPVVQGAKLGSYPYPLSRPLKLTLFPLDVTEKHQILRGDFRTTIAPVLAAGSPLAEFVAAFMNPTFAKVEFLQKDAVGDAVGLALHDPLCVWYCLACRDPKFASALEGQPLDHWLLTPWDEDIRVETAGQWTRGTYVVDRRSRNKMNAAISENASLDELLREKPGDTGRWLQSHNGNRLGRCLTTGTEKTFWQHMLNRIFGLDLSQSLA